MMKVMSNVKGTVKINTIEDEVNYTIHFEIQEYDHIKHSSFRYVYEADEMKTALEHYEELCKKYEKN